MKKIDKVEPTPYHKPNTSRIVSINARHLAIEAVESCLNSLAPLPVILDNLFRQSTQNNNLKNKEKGSHTSGANTEKSMSKAEVAHTEETVSKVDATNPEKNVSKEKAFCTELVYGYFRHAGLLRLSLANFVKKPQTLPQDCLIAVYLGTYEILFLQKDKNKDTSYATLFEYVEIIKERRGKTLSGVLNAVLRNVQRNKQETLEKIESAQISYTAPTSSNQIPSKKSIRSMHQLADLSEIFSSEINYTFLKSIVEESFFAPTPTYRMNTKQKHLLEEKLGVFEYAYFDEICLYKPALKTQDRAFFLCLKQWEQEGIITRQGVGSQILAKKIATFIKQNISMKENPLIWDACCGRGGKSSPLMEMGIPIHLCSDPNAERLNYAMENFKRLHLWDEKERNNPLFHTNTAQELTALLQENTIKNISEKFTCILLDSPCSTSGTIARNPEVKHRISKQTLETTVQLQADLLHSTWQCLKPKGYLVYITCSLFSKENEEQIKSFLNTHSALLIEQNYIIPHKISTDFIGHDVLFYAILQKPI